MTPQKLIAECEQFGVTIQLDGDRIKLRGQTQAVKAAVTILRPYKRELLKHLSRAPDNAAEVWGPYTPYCCPVSPELVTELHALIARYAQLYKLSAEATSRIIAVAKTQSLASIPNTVKFFKSEVGQQLRHGDQL